MRLPKSKVKVWGTRTKCSKPHCRDPFCNWLSRQRWTCQAKRSLKLLRMSKKKCDRLVTQDNLQPGLHFPSISTYKVYHYSCTQGMAHAHQSLWVQPSFFNFGHPCHSAAAYHGRSMKPQPVGFTSIHPGFQTEFFHKPLWIIKKGLWTFWSGMVYFIVWLHSPSTVTHTHTHTLITFQIVNNDGK